MASKKQNRSASTGARIPAALRRQLILESSMSLFARHGFHGTTTKEIARSAGVSEALIFRFFPDKESLYREVLYLCVEARGVADAAFIPGEPSTESLVRAVIILVYEVYVGFGGRARSEMLRRLQTHSMLEDGRFARAFFREHFEVYFPHVEKCIAAARKAGDLEPGIPLLPSIWFTHHLPMMVRLSQLPKSGIDYGADEEKLIDFMVLFCLRGLGLRSAAIKRLLPSGASRAIRELDSAAASGNVSRKWKASTTRKRRS